MSLPWIRRQARILVEDQHNKGPGRRDEKFVLWFALRTFCTTGQLCLCLSGLPPPSRAARFPLGNASPKHLGWVPAVLQGCGRGGAEARSGLYALSCLGLNSFASLRH
jgi:hypothetical protein